MEQFITSELALLQRRFKRSLQQETPATSQDSVWLREIPPIDLKKRLGVYQYAFWARLLESLEEDFPRTQSLLGNSKFRKVARDYLNKTSLGHFNLAELSRDFPKFVEKATKVSVGEVARFEWQENLCFLTEDPLPYEVSGVNGEADSKKLRFDANPSLHLFESKYSVLSKKVSRKTTRLILFRQHGRVQIQKAQENEFLVLNWIQKGHTFSKLYRHCTKHSIGEKTFAKWISRWTTQGIISGISIN